MMCPKCCKPSHLKINVTFQGTVIIYTADDDDGGDFEVVDSEPTDSEWVDSSSVACLDCGWVGTVEQLESEEVAS